MQDIVDFSLPFKNYEQHVMILVLKPCLMITCKLRFLDAHSEFGASFIFSHTTANFFLIVKSPLKSGNKSSLFLFLSLNQTQKGFLFSFFLKHDSGISL